MRKITRNEINKGNMIALGYCECKTILKLFGDDYKIGYNSGVYGWNYDLYNINGTSLVTGYNVPFQKYSDKEKKRKLIALENKVRKMSFSDCEKNELKNSFFKIFE